MAVPVKKESLLSVFAEGGRKATGKLHLLMNSSGSSKQRNIPFGCIFMQQQAIFISLPAFKGHDLLLGYYFE